jgi:hypothetical protein
MPKIPPRGDDRFACLWRENDLTGLSQSLFVRHGLPRRGKLPPTAGSVLVPHQQLCARLGNYGAVLIGTGAAEGHHPRGAWACRGVLDG